MLRLTSNQDQSWWAPEQSGQRNKAGRWRCLPTAIQPSSAESLTTRPPGPPGCSHAAAAVGLNKAPSWSAPARSETQDKLSRSLYPPTAILQSLAGLGTTRAPERHGFIGAAPAHGRSKATSWSAPVPPATPRRVFPSHCPPMAIQQSSVDLATTQAKEQRGCTFCAGASGPSRATN